MKEYYPIISGSICAGIGYIYGYMYEKNNPSNKRHVAILTSIYCFVFGGYIGQYFLLNPITIF